MGKEGTKEKLDIELEAPADFTSPEDVYKRQLWIFQI